MNIFAQTRVLTLAVALSAMGILQFAQSRSRWFGSRSGVILEVVVISLGVTLSTPSIVNQLAPEPIFDTGADVLWHFGSWFYVIGLSMLAFGFVPALEPVKWSHWVPVALFSVAYTIGLVAGTYFFEQPMFAIAMMMTVGLFAAQINHDAAIPLFIGVSALGSATGAVLPSVQSASIYALSSMILAFYVGLYAHSGQPRLSFYSIAFGFVLMHTRDLHWIVSPILFGFIGSLPFVSTSYIAHRRKRHIASGPVAPTYTPSTSYPIIQEDQTEQKGTGFWHFKRMVLSFLGLAFVPTFIFFPIFALTAVAIGSVLTFANWFTNGFRFDKMIIRHQFLKFKDHTGKLQVPPGWNRVLEVVSFAILFWRNRHDKVNMGLLLTSLAARFNITTTILQALDAFAKELTKLGRPKLDTDPPETMKQAESKISVEHPPSEEDETVQKVFSLPLVITAVGLFVAVLGAALGISHVLMASYRPPQNVHDLAAQIRDFNTLKEHGWPLLTATLNSLAKHIFGRENPLIPSQHADLVDRWTAINASLLKYQTVHPETYKREEVEELSMHRSNLFLLSNDMAKANAPTALQISVRSSWTWVSKLVVENEHLLVPTSRPAAFAIFVLGPAGTGKTDFTRFLATNALGPKARVWEANAQAKYDDGYDCQEVAFFDESFNASTDEMNVNFWVKFLQMNSSAMIPSIQAEAPKKGKLIFGTRFDVYASNKSLQDIKFLAQQAGLSTDSWRRRTPWIVELDQIRVQKTEFDTFYPDLKMYNWSTDKWMSISPDDLVHGIRIALQAADDAFARKEARSLARDLTLKRVVSSLTGTPYDVIAHNRKQYIEKWKKEHPQIKTEVILVENSPSQSIPPSIADPTEQKVNETLPKTWTAAWEKYVASRVSTSLSTYASTAYPRIWLYLHNLGLHPEFLPEGIPYASWESEVQHFGNIIRSHLSYVQRASVWFHSVKLTDPLLSHERFDQILNLLAEDASAFPINRKNVMAALNAYAQKTQISVSNLTDIQVSMAWAEWCTRAWDDAEVSEHRTILQWAKTHPLLVGLIGTAGVFAIAGACYLAWQRYSEDLSEEKSYTGDEKTPAHVKTASSPVLPKTKPHIMKFGKAPEEDKAAEKAAALRVTDLIRVDENAKTIAKSMRMHNIRVIRHAESNRMMNITFIRKRTGLVAGHFWRQWWSPSDMIEIINPNNGLVQRFSLGTLRVKNFYRDPDGGEVDPHKSVDEANLPTIIDMSVVTFPVQLNPFRDIEFHLAETSSHQYLAYSRIFICGWDVSVSPIAPCEAEGEVVMHKYPTVRLDKYKYISGNAIAFNGYVPAGMCSAVCMIENPHVKAKWAGCMASGNNARTYVTLLEKSMWDDEPLTLEGSPHESPSLPLITQPNNPEEDPSAQKVRCLAETFGRAPIQHQSRKYGETSLVRAPWNTWHCDEHEAEYLCGFADCPNTPTFPFPPAFAPFIMNGKEFDPIWEVFNKPKNHLLNECLIDGVPLLQFMRPVLKEFARTFVRPPLRGVPLVLSVDQALNGVYRPDGQCLLAPLNLETGLGLPLSNQRPESTEGEEVDRSGKRGFVVCPDHGNVANCPSSHGEGQRCRHLQPTPAVMEALNRDLLLIEKGTPPMWFVQITQKPDEPRDAKKFARVLTCFPFHGALIVRMYFACIFSGMTLDWQDSPYSIALNPHCLDAHDWVARRRAFGKRSDAGDLGSADNRFQWAAQEALVMPQVEALFEQFFEYSSGEFDAHMRKIWTTFTAMTTPYAIWATTIYAFFFRLFTGIPLTTQLNTIGYSGARLVAFYWVIWTEEHRIPELREYTALFASANVGDDYNNVIKDDYAGPYNMKKLGVALDEVFSMELTDPFKRAELPDFLPTEDAPFMRRSMVFHDGYWHLGLELRSRLRPKYYVRSIGPTELSNVANSVLLEHYEAGDIVRFNSDREEFREVLADLKVTWTAPLWSELDRRWRSRGFSLRDGIPDPSIEEDETVQKASSEPLDQVNSPAIKVDAKKTAELTAHTMNSDVVSEIDQPMFTDIVTDRFMAKPIKVGSLLGREIDGGQINWPTSSTFGTTLQSLNLPYDIIGGSVSFSQALYGLIHAKFDMIVRFKVNCPPLMEGSLAISFFPATDKAFTANGTTVNQRIQSHGWLVPASMLNDLEIRFPYSIAKNFIDLSYSSFAPNNYAIGSFFLDVWDPLLGQVNLAPTSVKLNLYWEVVDIVAGAGDPTAVEPMLAPVARERLRTALAYYKGKPFPSMSEDVTEQKAFSGANPFTTPRDPNTPTFNYISMIKEVCDQSGEAQPEYRFSTPVGPSHAPTFYCECQFRGRVRVASGRSKQESKMIAASLMWEEISFTAAITPTWIKWEDETFQKASSGNWRDVNPGNNPDLSKHVTRSRKDGRNRRQRNAKVPQNLIAQPPPPAPAVEVPLPKPSPEAAEKTQSIVKAPNLQTSDIGVAGAIGNTVSNVFATIGQFAESALPHLKSLIPIIGALLDKPVDERPASRMLADTGSPLPYTRGLQAATFLNTLPNAYVSNMLSERWTLWKIARRPGPYCRDTVTSATALGTFRTIPLSPSWLCPMTRTGVGPFSYTWNHTSLSYIASSLSYVWGDLDFLTVAICPPTVSFDLRVIYVPGNSNSTSVTAAAGRTGDYISKVFHVRGFTKIRFLVPLVSVGPMLPTGALIGSTPPTASIGGYLFFFNETAPVGQDTSVNASVYLTTFVAAGPNFRGFGLLPNATRQFYTVSLPEDKIARQRDALEEDPTDQKCNIEECFAEPSEYLVEGLQALVHHNICCPDMEADIVQLMKRPCYQDAITARYWTWNFLLYTTTGWTRFLQLFKYQRGSIVHTVVTSGLNWGQVSITYNSAGSTSAFPNGDYFKMSELGTEFYDLSKRATMSFIQPYISRDYYINANYSSLNETAGSTVESRVEINLDAYDGAGKLAKHYWAAGDDFGLHIIRPPPQETYSNAAITLPSGEVLEHMLVHRFGGVLTDLPKVVNAPLSDAQSREIRNASRSIHGNSTLGSLPKL